MSRLGIEWDAIVVGVQSHIILQNKTVYFILSNVAEVSTFTDSYSLVAKFEKCSRNRFSGKTLLPCGNHFYTYVRLRPEALCCRVVCTSVHLSVLPSDRLSVRPDYIFCEWEGSAGRGVIKANKKNQTGWAHGGGGGWQIFILVFFSYNAVTSLDYISLQAERVRPGVRGQGQFDFFDREAAGGQNKLEQKNRGVKANCWEGKSEMAMIKVN